MAKLGYYELTKVNYSFLEAIPAGFRKSYETLASYVKQLKKISRLMEIEIWYQEKHVGIEKKSSNSQIKKGKKIPNLFW